MLMGSGAFIFFPAIMEMLLFYRTAVIKAEFNSIYEDWSKEFVGVHYN